MSDYWPCAKLTVHEDEVRFGVYRVTASLYAPGLPPGDYDVWLPEGAAAPLPARSPSPPVVSGTDDRCPQCDDGERCSCARRHYVKQSEGAPQAPAPERLRRYLEDTLQEGTPNERSVARTALTLLASQPAGAAPEPLTDEQIHELAAQHGVRHRYLAFARAVRAAQPAPTEAP